MFMNLIYVVPVDYCTSSIEGDFAMVRNEMHELI